MKVLTDFSADAKVSDDNVIYPDEKFYAEEYKKRGKYLRVEPVRVLLILC